MAEKSCSAGDNSSNGTKAQQVCPGILYGPAYVTILGVDTNARTVQFQTAGTQSNAPVQVKCEWTQQNVWAGCPSSLDCDEQRLPEIGAQGTLYLSQSLVVNNHVAATVKWPDALISPPEYRPLLIWPTSILLEGIELSTGTMTKATIELLDPDLAAPGQTLTLDARPVTIDLSQRAFLGSFFVPWVSVQDLQTATATLSSKTPGVSAREKARAWARVAAWEELLGQPGAPQTADYNQARRLLAQIA